LSGVLGGETARWERDPLRREPCFSGLLKAATPDGECAVEIAADDGVGGNDERTDRLRVERFGFVLVLDWGQDRATGYISPRTMRVR